MKILLWSQLCTGILLIILILLNPPKEEWRTPTFNLSTTLRGWEKTLFWLTIACAGVFVFLSLLRFVVG